MTTTKGTRRTGGVKSRRQQVLFRGFFDAISHLLDPGLIVDHGSRRARRDRDLSRRHFLGWWWEHLRRDVALAGERRGHGQDWSHYIISIVRECNKKKKELCFVVGDVLRRATSRAKCNEDVWCRKKTKEGNTTNRRKKKGEDVTLFLPLKYILRDVERETAKKKTKERERDEKIWDLKKDY